MNRKTYFYNGEVKHLYNNQSHITVMKDDKRTGSGYLSIDNGTLFEAMRTLSSEALRIYLYLASNCDGFPMGWSPKDAGKVVDVDIKTARKGFLELKDKGYIIQCGEYDNDFVFHRSPVTEDEHNGMIRIDRLMAQQAVMASNKRMQKRLAYARTEEDYKGIEEDTDYIAGIEYPEIAKATEEEKGKEESEKIPHHVKMACVLKENPELYARYHSAQTKDEIALVFDMIRAAMIEKYGSA